MISLGGASGRLLVEAVAGDLRAFGIVVVTDIAPCRRRARRLDARLRRRAQVGRAARGRARARRQSKEEAAAASPTSRACSSSTCEEKPAPEDRRSGGGGSAGGRRDGEQLLPRDGDRGRELRHLRPRLVPLRQLRQRGRGGEGGESGEGSLQSYVYNRPAPYRRNRKFISKASCARRPTPATSSCPAARSASRSRTRTARASSRASWTLSSRGTFSGELDLPEESPLGYYNISAQTRAEPPPAPSPSRSTRSRVQGEGLDAAGPRPRGREGELHRLANYFFGAPVTRAEVKYYVYRSRDWAGGTTARAVRRARTSSAQTRGRGGGSGGGATATATR